MTRRRKIILGVLAAILLLCGVNMPWTISGAVNAQLHKISGDSPPQPCDQVLTAEVDAAGRSRRRPNGTLRVIGIQYKMDIAHVVDYTTYRTAMRCLMERYVVPFEKPGVPTLVVFPEDVGLETIAIGQFAARPPGPRPARRCGHRPATPVRPGSAPPCSSLNAAYAPQVAAYQVRFGGVDPRKEVLLAATDTFARAFSQTFSDIARDYGVYVVAANNQAPYRETHNPLEVKLFGDPTAARQRRVRRHRRTTSPTRRSSGARTTSTRTTRTASATCSSRTRRCR